MTVIIINIFINYLPLQRVLLIMYGGVCELTQNFPNYNITLDDVTLNTYLKTAIEAKT